MTAPGPIRVLIADDHKLIRRGLASVFRRKGGFIVVGEAANGRQAVELARELAPDVIVMDIRMPELDGIAATARILADNPTARVILLTMHRDDANVFAAIKAGALGYFLKDGDEDELIAGILAVHAGESSMDAEIASRALEEFRRLLGAGPADDLERLTRGEMDVLRLVAHGDDNAAIAAKLALSPGTVGNRLSAIFEKLRVNNRTQAALEALRRGWSTLDDA